MTTLRVLKCDGTRHSQPCRGGLTIPTHAEFTPRSYAAQRGWTDRGKAGDLCPSLNHDHQEAPA